tara:strand:+ start:13515 stop:14162 length:648 start_codon:yes stop_codon:yes gene_type:complete
MAQEMLKANDRTLGLSRGDLMRERKQGNIPAIFFGKGMDSVPLFVNQVEFQHVFQNKGKIFELEVGGKKHLVNTKFIHKDPLHKVIYQIDFHKLTKGVETTVKVPVNIIGESKGVKAGGTASQTRKVLLVKGTPMNIPDQIEVDITELEIGDSIHVKDINSGGKYSFEDEGELTVVTIMAPKKAEPEEEATEEALAGGEEAPAAEAAPAAEESKE